MPNSEQKILKLIEEFFSVANASDYQEVNNDLLQTFLETNVSDTVHDPMYVRNTVFMLNTQNQFILKLTEAIKSQNNLPL